MTELIPELHLEIKFPLQTAFSVLTEDEMLSAISVIIVTATIINNRFIILKSIGFFWATDKFIMEQQQFAVVICTVAATTAVSIHVLRVDV